MSGAKVSKDTIIYPVVLIDAIHIKIREGQVANGPIYTAVAVTVEVSGTFLAGGLATVVKGPSSGLRCCPRSPTRHRARVRPRERASMAKSVSCRSVASPAR